jgi:imidazolonepropionase-like amidohydrolase
MPADLWRALANAVDPGLFGDEADHPEQALAAVCGDAARAAGRDGGGIVAESAPADFCLLSSDPLAENFQAGPRIELCVLDGRPTWIAPRWQGR